MDEWSRKKVPGRVALVTGLALLACAGMLLGGCRRALPQSAREPVPRTLLGTWTTTASYSRPNDAGEIVSAGTLVFTLTFTRSRWIQHATQVPDDGTAGRRWAESGTWEADDGTVTRTWAEFDEQGIRVVRRLVKSYYWDDAAGDVLFIHPWDLLEPAADDEYERFERVRDPLPSPPIGEWHGSVPVDDGEGGTWDREYVVTINADGLFFSVEQRPGQWKRELIAQWHNDVEEYFLYLTDPAAFTELAGQEREPLFPEIINEDVTARIAYAPTDRSPAEMVVSPIWDEDGWPVPFRNDPGDVDGDYWLTLERRP